MDLTISTLALEAFLLVVVRVACFTAVSPIFGHQSVNVRLRILIAACISLTIYMATDVSLPEYETVFGYTLLVVKEAAVGLSMGFVCSFVMATLSFAGDFIDREIGFSMATTFDVSMGAMVTVSSRFYDSLVYVVIMITNLHYYMLTALAQSFELVPIGHADINFPLMYVNVLSFIGQFFSIGFRIAMPIFLGATILNIILGVLSKSSPQMNMFAVGIQLKVFIGLFILSIAIMFVPNITTFLMDKMQTMLNSLIGGL
ncbi:MAG: flagellar biosynthetic protein FliR [Wujia sp.]